MKLSIERVGKTCRGGVRGLALGVWTGSGRACEAIYTCLCCAVIQAAAPFDFTGAVASAPRRNPSVYAMVTLVLLSVALVGRRRRLQN